MPNFIFTETHEYLIMHYIMLVRQITSLTDCLLHIIRLHTRRTSDPEKSRIEFDGYKYHAQTEMADAICQIKKLCEILGLSFIETEEMGDVRYEEKKKEFSQKYPTDTWI